MKKQLLLISNSTNPGEAYLGWPKRYIREFLVSNTVKEVLFVPYAGVNLSDMGLEMSFRVYADKVNEVFGKMKVKLRSVADEGDPVKAVKSARAIVVGGGNTFHLVYMLHKLKLMDPIREKVISGTPFIGWSAGANIACPTLRTTNDMPIVQPRSFSCLDLVPFQINPHYLDANPAGHGGETREQRILEFMVINPNVFVVGLRESSLLRIEGESMKLMGRKKMRLFHYDRDVKEFKPGSDLSFLLSNS